MNTNKITDLHIQISKEDLKILDLLLKANEYSNIVFYCENDEEHFIFTEVKLGNYFCEKPIIDFFQNAEYEKELQYYGINEKDFIKTDI
ncbi:hypothetical protein [Campylobacter jejuni]|uniref:hypothetical protein n=1 Tax=Campylobacter jejuni TaxID=197 RepID=UPI00182A38E1|nr:hypothetical protein [Campylobacter jejuni]